jgi:hypothetical protein
LKGKSLKVAKLLFTTFFFIWGNRLTIFFFSAHPLGYPREWEKGKADKKKIDERPLSPKGPKVGKATLLFPTIFFLSALPFKLKMVKVKSYAKLKENSYFLCFSFFYSCAGVATLF